jgi:alpha-methylacyl-CoA racemase
MTGWGQSGPLSGAAGHDINYISLTGGLHATGESGGKPVPPVPPAGDFGGGAMFLAFGMVCALLESTKSGRGQVVDAAITDGSALLAAALHSLLGQGLWSTRRGANLLDGGAPFYGVYETRDGKYVSVGAIEPRFYARLLELTGLDTGEFEMQMDRTHWSELRSRMEALFRTRTRDEWCSLMEGTDSCFAPVLDFSEAPQHPHNKARETYTTVEGRMQPAPAPRFSRTTPSVKHGAPRPGQDAEAVLADWGVKRVFRTK